MKNEIAAVVVTYNRKALLSKCLNRILNQENISCDIVLIDNGSTDGTEEMIQNQYQRPEIIYKKVKVNLGGAGGFQYGVKYAAIQGYKFVWIMDDDTMPENNALFELVNAGHALDDNWGFLSSAVYWIDGKVCMANRPKVTLFSHVCADRCKQEVVSVIMSSFVSILVKTDVVREVGLPIGEYFIWTDDYEFSGRISRNYPCYMIKRSKVIHAMANHSKADIAIDDIRRLDRYFCLYRNDVHCYRNYGVKGWIYIILKDIYAVFNILKNSRDGKRDRLKTVLKGFKAGVCFNPQLEMLERIF
ncbi:MAG: glycosyltransferase family 2 protein [Lachnospiraceae bacterium]|nr:glycosyltransferase family 2 protein [Lachnospiraceae bacterium]